MHTGPLPTDIDDCHRLIATLQTQVETEQQTISQQATVLERKGKLIEQQAHSVLELKANHDKLDEQVSELNLKIEKLLQQLYGRKSERRIDGVGQTLQNIERSVEFALRPLAEHLRSYLKTDHTIGCDDTGVLLITPQTMPDLSDHPRGERIGEVFEKAIAAGKPSIKANFWGYYASRLPVVAFDFTVSRHRDGPDDVPDSSRQAGVVDRDAL